MPYLSLFNSSLIYTRWVRRNATNQEVAGLNYDEVIGFFSIFNPSSRTMVLGLTQPQTEMSTKNFDGSKAQPARKADNLTAVCEPAA
jgi:hypothetical protein